MEIRQKSGSSAVLVQLALRWGRSCAAQWRLARAVGKRPRGCREKRLYVNSANPQAFFSFDPHPWFELKRPPTKCGIEISISASVGAGTWRAGAF